MVYISWAWILAAGMATSAPDTSVDAATATYYRQALPQAVRFETKSIDANLLAPADKGNTVYLSAFNKDGALAGFIREFTGPVSTAGLCPCNPLAVTLVFAPNLDLLTVLTRAPLQKWGHAPMTPAEQERIIAIAKNPAPELLAATRGEDLIDATTGATRQAYAPVVVGQAALSTQRLVNVVQQTRLILKGAPASEERIRLGRILAAHAGPAKLAADLAALLPDMQSADLQLQIYHYLAATYLDAQQHGAPADPAVEDRLASPHLLHERNDDDVAQAVYALADAGVRPAFVRRCIKQLEGSSVAPPYLALLRGTERFFANDLVAALPPLREAAGIFGVGQVPLLHWRLAKAAMAVGQNAMACRTGQDLFALHPMLPNLSEVMATCEDSDAKVEALRQQSRNVLLRGRLAEGTPVRPTVVRDANNKARKLALRDTKRVTVAVFFATWCPHCRKELPRINDYVTSLSKQDKSVQVFGIRTAVDKETQTYAQFVKEVAPAFPIYTDQADSKGFAAFSKDHNLPMALPCVAIIDTAGIIRYILEPGDWRDTKSELEWAVASLSPAAVKDPANRVPSPAVQTPQLAPRP